MAQRKTSRGCEEHVQGIVCRTTCISRSPSCWDLPVCDSAKQGWLSRNAWRQRSCSMPEAEACRGGTSEAKHLDTPSTAAGRKVVQDLGVGADGAESGKHLSAGIAV